MRVRIALVLAASAGCGRSPVVAGQVPVAPAPRLVVVDPRAEAAEAVVAQARDELARRQRLRAGGAGSADRVDVAEFQLHAAATELAVLKRDAKAELASRTAEVAVLARRWERAAATHRIGTESAEVLNRRLAELTEARARLARFNGEQRALVAEHTVLVELAERELRRVRAARAAGAVVADEVLRCELAVAEERRRLDAAKALRLAPRRVD
jgi:hypothetical protein